MKKQSIIYKTVNGGWDIVMAGRTIGYIEEGDDEVLLILDNLPDDKNGPDSPEWYDSLNEAKRAVEQYVK